GTCRADLCRRISSPRSSNRSQKMTAATVSSSSTNPATPTSTTTTPAPQLIDVSKLPAEQGVAKLIDHAVKMGASDLFFAANEQHMAVLVRHLGIVRPISILPPEVGRRHLSHIKANSQMDLTEKRRPADGRWIFRRDGSTLHGDAVDLRHNVIPTLYAEDFESRRRRTGETLARR